MRKKFISVIAIILCVSVAFSGSVFFSQASAQEQESETAASSERAQSPWEVLSQTIGSLLFGGTQTDGIGDKAKVRAPFIIAPFQESPGFLMNIKSWLWIGTKVEVLDYWGNYAYVKRVETEEKGYIHTLCIDDPAPKLVVSKEYEHVYEGVTKTLTYSYNGAKEVKCSLSKSGIVKCDVVKNGIQITGLNPGTVKLTVKAGAIEKTLDVHCVYQWKKPWTAVALASTTIYRGPDESYGVRASLAKGTRFVVKGDEGGSDGWAYGYIYNTDTWGFVRIEDVSTKNTISYYKSLNIGYPIENTSIKYISSPYAKRSDDDLHRGFDITGGGSYIYGENLVSPVNGKVVFVNTVCTDNNTKPSYGYCITIETNGGKFPKTAISDPITGKYLTITFMHLSQAPILKEGDKVEAGDVVGKIGNTGNVRGSAGVNPKGTHLHLEINNMAAIVGSSLRTDFTYNINPIYFYINKNFDLNTGSSAYKTYGAYWYGPNK